MKSFDELFATVGQPGKPVFSERPAIPVVKGVGQERSPSCGVMLDEQVEAGEHRVRRPKLTYERLDPLDRCLFNGLPTDDVRRAVVLGTDDPLMQETVEVWNLREICPDLEDESVLPQGV